MTATKCGDLDDFSPHPNVNDLKAAPYDSGIAKALFDFVGGGIGGHIEIFRLLADEQIPHCAAYNVGVEALLF